MARRVTEIAVQFREPPHLMFPLDKGKTITPNVIAIRVQPEEGISLSFDIKVPGIGVRMTAARMDFSYAEAFGAADPLGVRDAAARLHGGRRHALHPRRRGRGRVGSGRSGDRGLEASKDPEHFPNYAAGSWGPAIADEFIARDGARWRQP